MSHAEEDNTPRWLWIVFVIYQVILFLICVSAAWVALKLFGPGWGLLASIIAVFLWLGLGPKSVFIFIVGIMGTWVLTSNIVCGSVAGIIIIIRFIHRAA